MPLGYRTCGGQSELNCATEDMDEHLLNIYPHIPLTQEIAFPLSALSKVWLFVALCRRLGLDAHPSMAVPDRTPVCCVCPRDPTKLPVVVEFAASSQVRPVNLTPAYQQMVRFVEGDLPTEMAWRCLPEFPMSVWFEMALEEALQGLARYRREEHEDWLYSEQERLCTATHAIQCALILRPTAAEKTSLIYRGQMEDMFPLDAQAIMLDVLLASAQRGSPGGDVATDVRISVMESENLERLVMRRSRYRRSNIPYVGTVVPHPMLDDSPGFELRWKVCLTQDACTWS